VTGSASHVHDTRGLNEVKDHGQHRLGGLCRSLCTLTGVAGFDVFLYWMIRAPLVRLNWLGMARNQCVEPRKRFGVTSSGGVKLDVQVVDLLLDFTDRLPYRPQLFSEALNR